MDMMSALQQAGGIEAVSRELGIDPSTAQAGVGALLPAVLEGVGAKAQDHPQGLGGLGSILASLGGGGLLGNVLSPSEPTNIDQGNDILGSIFGSKDGSRAVATDASRKSGIPPELLKKMLPIVAMLVAGYLSKHATKPAAVPVGADAPDADTQADGGLLGSLLGAATSGAGGGILGSILGGLTRKS